MENLQDKNVSNNIKRIGYFDDRFYKLELTEPMLEFVNETWPSKPIYNNFVYLPSSTTKLGIMIDYFLLTWYGDLGTEKAKFKSEKARRLGSEIHDLVHGLWLGNEYNAELYKQETWVQLYRFKQWFDSLKPTLIKNPELTVYSLKHWFAGTLDMPVFIKGGKYNTGYAKPVEIPEGNYIGDLKTGKTINKKAHYQTGSYAEAFSEMYDIEIEGTFIMHTQADTRQGWKMIIRNREEWKQDFEGFKTIAATWELENGNMSPKIFDMPAKLSLYEEKEGI